MDLKIFESEEVSYLESLRGQDLISYVVEKMSDKFLAIMARQGKLNERIINLVFLTYQFAVDQEKGLITDTGYYEGVLEKDLSDLQRLVKKNQINEQQELQVRELIADVLDKEIQDAKNREDEEIEAEFDSGYDPEEEEKEKPEKIERQVVSSYSEF